MAADHHPGRDGEPVLDVREIQGNVLPGFRTRHQALVFLQVTGAGAAAAWLREMRVTTLADVLAVREGRGRGGDGSRWPWVNVALTQHGLSRFLPGAGGVTDMPLKQGLHRRSTLLGDPASPDAEGCSGNWVVGRPDEPVDVLLLLASEELADVAGEVAALERRPPDGTRVVFVQHGQVLPEPMDGKEPFGFCDDISQPGVRGRLSDAPGDFLTPSASGDPDQGLPGQALVWPGEFVFGYPAQDAFDKRRPGLPSQGGPSWTRNASLLVFRRLRQDVAAFEAFVRAGAEELAARHPALAGLTPEAFAAKLMGRWPSGTPLMTNPAADQAGVGGDPERNNDFSFLAGGGTSAADPLGFLCPRAAHIRRAYPRDSATSGLTEASIERHRLLRRSIPFADRRDGAEERGLLFLAYQTSIERQFEFVTRAWLNNPHLHDTDDGHDPIVGQSFGARGDRARIFSLPVTAGDGTTERVTIELPRDWVVPTGGEYFLTPPVSAVRAMTAHPAGVSRRPLEPGQPGGTSVRGRPRRLEAAPKP